MESNFYAEKISEVLLFLQNNFDYHFHLESMMQNMSFSDCVTKDLIISKSRDLSYSIYDAEKTKLSNS